MDRTTDRRANFLAAHFLPFRDGRIIDYCAIVDSLDLMPVRLRVALSARDQGMSAHRSLLGGASFAQVTL
jgi:hypothetical protein